MRTHGRVRYPYSVVDSTAVRDSSPRFVRSNSPTSAVSKRLSVLAIANRQVVIKTRAGAKRVVSVDAIWRLIDSVGCTILAVSVGASTTHDHSYSCFLAAVWPRVSTVSIAF